MAVVSGTVPLSPSKENIHVDHVDCEEGEVYHILDGLEEGTRPLMLKAREELENRHGKAALDPWNTGYMMAGSVIKKMVSVLK